MKREIFQREELLIGEENLKKLQQKHVAVFGLGGVGSYVVEGLVRAGIGNFTLIDFDKVDLSNINRQIIATTKTLGRYKVDVEEERIKEINPNVNVITYKEFVRNQNENVELFEHLKDVDYIVDAIDTVTAKIRIIEFANKNNINIISALGTGNKLNPTKLKLEDIYNTKVCPLAKVIRKELRKRNVEKLDVVYSEEEPIKVPNNEEKKVVGSISFVPSIAGLMISYKVINNLMQKTVGEMNVEKIL